MCSPSGEYNLFSLNLSEASGEHMAIICFWKMKTNRCIFYDDFS